jgi:GNAT superfamily N-acetyltransferase
MERFRTGLAEDPTPNAVTFIAMRQQEVIGIGTYRVTDPLEAEVDVIVAPTFRSQGVGAFMLQMLAAHAYAASIRTFTANITDNDIAVSALIQNAALGARLTPAKSGATGLHLELAFCGPLVKALRSQALFHTSPHNIRSLLQNLQTLRDENVKQL